jgi:hypothetical protein
MLKIKKLDTRGITHLLLPILIISLVAAAGSYIVIRSSANIDGTTDINNIYVELGAEQLVADPAKLAPLERNDGTEHGTIADNSYFIEKEKGKYYGFLANKNSYAFPLDNSGDKEDDDIYQGIPIIPSSADQLKRHLKLPNDPRPKNIADKAKFEREERQGKHPDSCGAWLLSTIQENPNNRKHWIAWYHGEDRCNYSNGGETHMTLAFTESFDEGKTWKKPNYPNNRVITASPTYKTVDADDTGGGRTLRIGDYYYMFYKSSGEVKQTAANGVVTMVVTTDNLHVARSKVSDLGKPGTWKKWYCRDSGNRATCGYTEPGIGGRSTPISATPGAKPKTDLVPSSQRFVTYNRYLNRYITMQAHGDGFQLRASNGDDFLTWKAKKETVYPAVTNDQDFTVQNWNYGVNSTSKKCQRKKPDGTSERTNFECKQLYMYSSVIGLQGDGEGLGRRFYLYYTKVYPGEEHDQRYVFRRLVTLNAKKIPSTQDKTTRVALTQYQDKNGRQRITTESPQPSLGYKVRSTIGYVLSHPSPGYHPLFECKRPNGEYYTMRLATDDPYAVPVVPPIPDPPTKCNGRDTLVRRIGWASPKRTSEASVAITNSDPSSGAAARSAAIGYALPPLESN